jgi:uncharacterized protein YkwD
MRSAVPHRTVRRSICRNSTGQTQPQVHVPAKRRIGSASSLGFAIIVLALVVVGCGDMSGGPPTGPESPGVGGLEDAVTALVNDHRQALGCPRLVWNVDLAGVALDHSRDMLERDYFGHYDPDGRGLKQRLESARIYFHAAAENIAQGFRYENAAQAVFDGWMKSPGHRTIIENCTFVVHGIGIADYRWTHVFMR